MKKVSSINGIVIGFGLPQKGYISRTKDANKRRIT
ncbi:MAG: hypothetical protein JWQ40_3825 [Segetibacter sp.]|jgi:hypothetical protein|nr:hypothetical protein [Segetibacter sp.]